MKYTGIGSRNTPDEILALMKDLAQSLAVDGYTLRSGGADGADTAFEVGCDWMDGKKEIYLPWKGFNNNKSNLYEPPSEAEQIAEEVYGAKWKYIGRGVRALMSRNIQQVCGKDLNYNSSFVVCWTTDGCESAKTRQKITGGTGQAIEYADTLNIPIFNLANDGAIEKLKEYVAIIGAVKW